MLVINHIYSNMILQATDPNSWDENLCFDAARAFFLRGARLLSKLDRAEEGSVGVFFDAQQFHQKSTKLVVVFFFKKSSNMFQPGDNYIIYSHIRVIYVYLQSICSKLSIQ